MLISDIIEDITTLSTEPKLGKLPHEEVESVIHQWVNQEDHIELSNGMHVLSGENHGYDDNVALIVDADYKILDHDDDIVELMQQFTAQEIDPSIVETIVEKCWKGYQKKGMKTMFGKRVPNCVKNEDMSQPNFDDDDDEEVEYYDEIHPVVIKAWKSVYPNVPLKAIDDEDMYMQYTTADEYKHHGGNGKDFYLSLGVQYIGDDEPPKGYVNVGDAYAGNYKGVVAKIIASLFEWLEKQHPSMGVRELGIHMNRNAEAWNSIAQKVGAQIEKRGYYENFADGKVKGKSRPGRVKKAGASCKGSVTDLRAKAKKYSGEKGKMYHWCANMKSGKK